MTMLAFRNSTRQLNKLSKETPFRCQELNDKVQTVKLMDNYNEGYKNKNVVQYATFGTVIWKPRGKTVQMSLEMVLQMLARIAT